MNRFALLLVCFGLLSLAALPGQQRAPNVILLMADDLGHGDVGVHGHRIVQTPALDGLARDGVRFTRFHAAAPVCSPTRASCLTGQHPYRHGIRGANQGSLGADAVTLQKLLKEQGYRTGHFGKWHLGTLTKTLKESNRGGPRGAAHYAPPQERGFDVCFSTEAKVPTHDPMVHPDTGKPYGTHYWSERGELVKDNLQGDDSRVIMDRVLPFVQKCASDEQPFFAVVWFHSPHLPVEASDADRARYAELSDLEQRYYGCITAMDREVGRLRTTLDELEIADDTILWFCSDNGPERRTPGTTGGLRARKRSLYEGGTRVPAFLVWPRKLPGGSVFELPAVTSDFLPTLASWCGFDLPVGPLDGVDLSPAIDAACMGEPVPARTPIGFESAGMVAWTTARWKLVGHGKRRAGEDPFSVERYELFDLLEDEAEAEDVADDHPDVVSQMRAELEEWRRGVRSGQ